mgnify:CR=1 FL=1
MVFLNILEIIGVVSSIVSIVLFIIAFRSTSSIPSTVIQYENNLTRTTYLSAKYLGTFSVLLLGLIMSIPFSLAFLGKHTHENGSSTLFIWLCILIALYYIKILVFTNMKDKESMIKNAALEMMALSFVFTCAQLVERSSFGLTFILILYLLFFIKILIMISIKKNFLVKFRRFFEKNSTFKYRLYTSTSLILVLLFSMLSGSTLLFLLTSTDAVQKILFGFLTMTFLVFSFSETIKMHSAYVDSLFNGSLFRHTENPQILYRLDSLTESIAVFFPIVEFVDGVPKKPSIDVKALIDRADSVIDYEQVDNPLYTGKYY